MESVVTKGGQRWYNRGMKTFPMAKSWLRFDDVAFLDHLCLSAYCLENDTTVLANPKGEEEAWRCLARDVSIKHAVETMADIISNPPTEILSGFQVITIPTPVVLEVEDSLYI